jgi:hypothetical protein
VSKQNPPRFAPLDLTQISTSLFSVKSLLKTYIFTSYLCNSSIPVKEWKCPFSAFDSYFSPQKGVKNDQYYIEESTELNRIIRYIIKFVDPLLEIDAGY